MSFKTKQARIEKHKKAVYNLTAEQLDSMEDKIKRSALNEAFVTMLALPVMVINDHYKELIRLDVGGKGRSERFAELCLEKWDEFMSGKISIDSCHKLLKDSCGIVALEEVNKRD